MVLDNYVRLVDNKPSRLHFVDHVLTTDTIVDPKTRQVKQVNRLVFQVDELDGRPVVSTYSILSDKHAKDFNPYLSGERYKNYDFVITVSGEGLRREYSTQPQLRLPK